MATGLVLREPDDLLPGHPPPPLLRLQPRPAAQARDDGRARDARSQRLASKRRAHLGGARTQIGERVHLWAGDTSGRITIGEQCRFGPEVFVTASDYGLRRISRSPTRSGTSATSSIGDDVWLGAPGLRRRRRDDRRRVRGERGLGRHQVAPARLGRRRHPRPHRATARGLRAARGEGPTDGRGRPGVGATGGSGRDVSVDVSVLIVTYHCRRPLAPASSPSTSTPETPPSKHSSSTTRPETERLEMVAEEFPEARLFALAENVGFARAVNLAAEQARGSTCCSSTPIPRCTRGCWTPSSPSPEASPRAICGGRTLRPDGRLDQDRAGARPPSGASSASPPRSPASSEARVSSTRSHSAVGSATRFATWTSSRAACCSSRASSGESWADSIRGSSSTGRTLTWRFGPPPRRAPRDLRMPWSPTRVGVSSATRPDKLLLLYRGKVTL